MKLTIATCQFPVDADIKRNLDYVLRQMKSAYRRGAQLVHFSETCLSGYALREFDSFQGFHWELLRECTRAVMAMAKTLRLWVILGSTHRIEPRYKPHNSLYIINPDGNIVDRYDKMFCCGDKSGKTDDLKYYSPGHHFCVFNVEGIRCGVLICHDFRYDELYRVYKKKGVQLMFHSYHMAHITEEQFKASNYRKLVPATMQTYSANNSVWIVANNSSRPYSCFPGFFVDPEGNIIGRLANNRPGVLIRTVDSSGKFYDASGAWRDRAVNGTYHSGTLVKSLKSERRTEL